MENEKEVDRAVVYGDTLHAMRLHMDAELMHGAGVLDESVVLFSQEGLVHVKEEIEKTNARLPQRFQRPHPPTPVE